MAGHFHQLWDSLAQKADLECQPIHLVAFGKDKEIIAVARDRPTNLFRYILDLLEKMDIEKLVMGREENAQLRYVKEITPESNMLYVGVLNQPMFNHMMISLRQTLKLLDETGFINKFTEESDLTFISKLRKFNSLIHCSSFFIPNK